MVNAQTEIILGYSRVELLGQSIDIFLPERYRHQLPHHRVSFFSILVHVQWELVAIYMTAAGTLANFL